MNCFQELKELLKNAWCPYSGFQVASIAIMSDGKKFIGVNVESSAFPTTMCAERNAIYNAIANGYRAGSLTQIHILAKRIKGDYEIAYPCGACRQVIAEQSLNRAKIYIYNFQGKTLEYNIAQLLPEAFFLEA